MMIKISICDDDLAFCRSLQQIVSQKLEALKESHTITCYYSSASFLAGPMDFVCYFWTFKWQEKMGFLWPDKLESTWNVN